MNSFSYILLFILTLLAFFLLHVNSKKTKIFGLFLLIILFSYICSIRPYTSADTSTYLWYYEQTKNISRFQFGFGRDYFPWIENWFINLSWFCNCKLHLDFRVFLFFISFLFNYISTFSLISIFKSKYGNILNSHFIFELFLLFFVNYGFLYSYVVIRGGLSFAFCLLSYAFFLKKNYYRSFLSLLIAILLHNYSLIFIPILLISKISFKNNYNRLFLTVFVILLFMNLIRFDVMFTNYLQKFSFLFSDKYYQVTHYLMDAEQTTSLRKGIVLYLVQNIYLCLLLFNNKENFTNEFLILLFGSFIAVLINDNGTMRITNYFFLFQIFLYGKYLFDNITNNNNRSRNSIFNVIIITILIPLFTFVYMLRYCGII